MAKRIIKKVAIKVDDQEPQILNRVILNPARSFFRDNRWWIAPVVTGLTIAIPWLVNYGSEKEEERLWRATVGHQVSNDSLNVQMIFDTLDVHKDNFNNLKKGSYKQ